MNCRLYMRVWGARRGVQSLQLLNSDCLWRQRLSTTYRCDSTTTTTAEGFSKYPVTHNAVQLFEPQLTMHWLNRLCTVYFLTVPSMQIPISKWWTPQNDRKMTKLPIVSNAYQNMLEAAIVHENAENVIQDHNASAVECHCNACRLSQCSCSTAMAYQRTQNISHKKHMASKQGDISSVACSIELL